MGSNEFSLHFAKSSFWISTVFLLFLSACRESPKVKADQETVAKDDFEFIFDGNSLDGWDGDLNYWRAENGVLIGEITPETLLNANT
ncbi:MAG: hypothetical protein KJN76_13170, partial [Eudoraea sp.]|nr:hypothetical protein [Eudoraea sp.]